MKTKIHDDGILPLASAIIEQAIDDCRYLQARGFIVDGKAVEATRVKGGDRYSAYQEARSLVYFFSPLGELGELLSLAGFNISESQIRNRLGLL